MAHGGRTLMVRILGVASKMRLGLGQAKYPSSLRMCGWFLLRDPQVLSKSLNGTEFFPQRTLSSDLDLEVQGPKGKVCITCSSPGISCSYFGTSPPTPLNLRETGWNQMSPSSQSPSSGPHGLLLSSTCAMRLATQREGHAQHLLINHSLSKHYSV